MLVDTAKRIVLQYLSFCCGLLFNAFLLHHKMSKDVFLTHQLSWPHSEVEVINKDREFDNEDIDGAHLDGFSFFRQVWFDLFPVPFSVTRFG